MPLSTKDFWLTESVCQRRLDYLIDAVLDPSCLDRKRTRIRKRKVKPEEGSIPTAAASEDEAVSGEPLSKKLKQDDTQSSPKLDQEEVLSDREASTTMDVEKTDMPLIDEGKVQSVSSTTEPAQSVASEIIQVVEERVMNLIS